MAKMIINQKVEDFGKWKSQFDAMSALRKQFGCTGEQVFKGDNNPNEVVIITQWGNNDQARSYGQSNDLKEGMKKAGVTGASSIYFVD